MARSALTFRQRDLARALKAARAAGVEVARYTVARDGTITVYTGTSTTPDDNGCRQNPWLTDMEKMSKSQ